ncbi:hypothetical protein FIBSPDRAFT_886033 [Athelia psychrophila]|uniref:Uncharacterized protein n=1 Tax=Athelia psychrophila TaxID=1759441 RepID=A0A166RDI1_9AGAM|nr:hypothetical protein FIBSPDRAFT_886033 [Fibularhizoctonia sp. CBS 109695]
MTVRGGGGAVRFGSLPSTPRRSGHSETVLHTRGGQEVQWSQPGGLDQETSGRSGGEVREMVAASGEVGGGALLQVLIGRPTKGAHAVPEPTVDVARDRSLTLPEHTRSRTPVEPMTARVVVESHDLALSLPLLLDAQDIVKQFSIRSRNEG